MNRMMMSCILFLLCGISANAQNASKHTKPEAITAITIYGRLPLDADIPFEYGFVKGFNRHHEYAFGTRRFAIYPHAEIYFCGALGTHSSDCRWQIYIPLSQNNPSSLQLSARIDSGARRTQVRISKSVERFDILFTFATAQGLEAWQRVLHKAGLNLQLTAGAEDAEVRFRKAKYMK